MLKFFKLIAILEGISSVLLFFVAVPMKYIFHNKQFIRPFGMAHGFLFTIFVIIAFVFAITYEWNFKKIFIVFVCAIIPCGTFYVDAKYLKNV
ncbi:MAG: DUF3817 domain-containing protein [Flavobacterium sp.]|nr:DUF3817 domain-containing protein [Flavobacterium sp.]